MPNKKKVVAEGKKRIARLNTITIVILVISVVILVMITGSQALHFKILQGTSLLLCIAAISYWIVMRSVYAIGLK